MVPRPRPREPRRVTVRAANARTKLLGTFLVAVLAAYGRCRALSDAAALSVFAFLRAPLVAMLEASPSVVRPAPSSAPHRRVEARRVRAVPGARAHRSIRVRGAEGEQAGGRVAAICGRAAAPLAVVVHEPRRSARARRRGSRARRQQQQQQRGGAAGGPQHLIWARRAALRKAYYYTKVLSSRCVGLGACGQYCAD